MLRAHVRQHGGEGLAVRLVEQGGERVAHSVADPEASDAEGDTHHVARRLDVPANTPPKAGE